MSKLKELNLETFANGAAAELFQNELEKVLKNIGDINTKADTKREITLTFSIKPDEHRDTAQLLVESKSKIAPTRGAGGQMYFGKTNGGNLKAYTQDINQLELDVEVKPTLVQEKRA